MRPAKKDDRETLVTRVDIHLLVNARKIEMVHTVHVGLVLQLAMVVRNAHRANMSAFQKQHLNDGLAVVL